MFKVKKSLAIVSFSLIATYAHAGIFLNNSGQTAYEHLQELQRIAIANNGHRAAGSSGHSMSANYVAQQLLAVGYEVKLTPFEFTQYKQIGSANLTIQDEEANTHYKEEDDFNVMTFSPSGDITGSLESVDLELGSDNQSSSGCEEADFVNFTKGKIALIQRGSCSFSQKALHAQNAGAIAVLIFNQGNEETRTDVFGGTLSADAEITVPVFSLSYQIGVNLSMAPQTVLRMQAETSVKTVTTYNVVAETPGGRADNVVMLGSHLDSVPAGPGLNDNGSGSAGILDVAIRIMDVLKDDQDNYNKLRFSWWSAEEVGLIGSSRYVDALSEDEKSNIALYLNFDMIASPNYMLGVFDGDGSTFNEEGPKGSDAIERFFELHLGLTGAGSVPVAMSGRSDYAPFAEIGIPVGGLFTGAEGTMSQTEADLFGGVAGKAYDHCYHKECDNIDNINKEALAINVNAIAAAALTFAYSTHEVNGSKFERSLSREKSYNHIRFEKTDNVHCAHTEHLK